MDRRVVAAGIAVLVLIVLLASWVIHSPSRPSVVIDSPPGNSQFYDGQTVSVQSTSTDSGGVAKVELDVDGLPVRTDPAPGPVVSFTVSQAWKATPGSHTLSVRAYNISNLESAPALVQVAVLPTTAPAAAPTLTSNVTVVPSPSAAPTALCSDHSAFIADVTVPDGTVVAARQGFDKTWRVRNIGTCTWDNSYIFTFVGGEAMTTNTTLAVPETPPGGTADLTVSMVAPPTPGEYIGLWRLEGPNGVHFGVTLNLSITVPGAPPPALCSGTPNIASFAVSPTTITAGQSATLSWGFVSNANLAVIDQRIGGVATPGKTTVSPRTTTTYTLTAYCGKITQTAHVTVTVLPIPTVTSLPGPTATATAPPPTATPTLAPAATPNPTPAPSARASSDLTGNP